MNKADTISMDAKKFVQRLKQKKKQDKIMLQVRIDEALREALFDFAKANGLSVAQVVEGLLEDLLVPGKGK